jgi:hypothetical protein
VDHFSFSSLALVRTVYNNVSISVIMTVYASGSVYNLYICLLIREKMVISWHFIWSRIRNTVMIYKITTQSRECYAKNIHNFSLISFVLVAEIPPFYLLTC